MSAGNIIGLFFNLFAFATIWTFVGWVVDRIAIMFNSTLNLLPSLQDAATGFSLVQMIYGIIPAIAFVVILFNYYLNEHSREQAEV